jgi:hypothetical protein
MRRTRLVIADRSDLAANMYGLLLAPLDCELIARKRFEEVRPFYFRREKVDMGLFNSNIFGKKFNEIYEHLSKDEPLRFVKKIFILREDEEGSARRKMLAALPNTTIIYRPFYPADFFKVVGGLFA